MAEPVKTDELRALVPEAVAARMEVVTPTVAQPWLWDPVKQFLTLAGCGLLVAGVFSPVVASTGHPSHSLWEIGVGGKCILAFGVLAVLPAALRQYLAIWAAAAIALTVAVINWTNAADRVDLVNGVAGNIDHLEWGWCLVFAGVAIFAAVPLLPSARDFRPGVQPFDRVLRFGLPLIVILAFLLLWQLVPQAAGFSRVELPNLLDTLVGLKDDWPTIGTSLLVTIQDALAGFILGNLFAILGATAFIYSRSMERAFFPMAILIQTIPIIVYAPLFTIFFFRTPALDNNPQAAAVVAVAVLITFFPTLVNMTVGLKTIDPRVYELMRLLNSSKTQIFLKLRFPSAMPFLFSSLKITATLAFVGAIVGEYMVNGGFNPIGQGLSDIGVSSLLGFPTAPTNATGIGGQFQTFYSELDKPGIFASVFAVSLLSMLFFGLMVVLERLLIPWQKQQ